MSSAEHTSGEVPDQEEIARAVDAMDERVLGVVTTAPGNEGRHVADTEQQPSSEYTLGGRQVETVDATEYL